MPLAHPIGSTAAPVSRQTHERIVCTAEGKDFRFDTIPQSEAIDPRYDHGNPADDLVPRHQSELRIRRFSVEHVKIGPAYPAGRDRDQNLVGTGREVGPTDQG